MGAFVNIVVNSVLDLIVVRSIGFLILAFPLKFNTMVQIHIDH